MLGLSDVHTRRVRAAWQPKVEAQRAGSVCSLTRGWVDGHIWGRGGGSERPSAGRLRTLCGARVRRVRNNLLNHADGAAAVTQRQCSQFVTSGLVIRSLEVVGVDSRARDRLQVQRPVATDSGSNTEGDDPCVLGLDCVRGEDAPFDLTEIGTAARSLNVVVGARKCWVAVRDDDCDVVLFTAVCDLVEPLVPVGASGVAAGRSHTIDPPVHLVHASSSGHRCQGPGLVLGTGCRPCSSEGIQRDL